MKFIDLGRQYKSIRGPVLRSLARTMERGQFILGPHVERVEQRVARVVGVPHAVGVNSGTDAIFLALKALGIGKGDEVITTPFSFIATAETIAHTGARPVFADIDSRTYNLNSQNVERRITTRTKAIIPVHLYGQMADTRAIMHIAKSHGLFVIEDAAQALGASQRTGRGLATMAGSAGSIGCFSFFPTKNLGAYGDGGMVVTRNRNIAQKIRLLRNHGAPRKYHHTSLGYSSRLDEMQAAVLLAKLPLLRQWQRVRTRIAAFYTHRLSAIPQLVTPFTAPGNVHAFHQYTIRTAYRDKIRSHLERAGIPTAIHYPLPLHLQPAFRYLRQAPGSFPEAERASREVLSLPIYPELKRREQERVVRSIEIFFSRRV